MSRLSENWQQVHRRISAACQSSGRTEAPLLLAVSKKHPAEKVAALAALGQVHFGESYAQEGVEKIKQLAHLSLVWHFIGPIQSNKTKLIAEHFDWVHSVDRPKVLQRLSDQRPAGHQPLQVLLQLKVGEEVSKSGADVATLKDMADWAAKSASIELRGVMCIPPPSPDHATQLAYLRQAKVVFDDLRQQHPKIDTLSMGMSQDLAAAIEAGSTCLRVGTDLLGPREY
ncbi:YggS family pyridoxal phosphate-dependent enzyme [Marinicella meishanensis]|uniref:YggS family pyridoxal phosphate-dependent enzyme n=1 Tax=Marinicella meishanensis TaxID=2873263 RepID=UPI001CBD5022|nr:YggS family pyridoxal phosphate-dependent enzyme [Marinicella sp. NBU2979]